MSDDLHERARAVLTRIEHDRFMRQGDPVMTLKTFMETEIENASERGAREMVDIIEGENCGEHWMQLWREAKK